MERRGLSQTAKINLVLMLFFVAFVVILVYLSAPSNNNISIDSYGSPTPLPTTSTLPTITPSSTQTFLPYIKTLTSSPYSESNYNAPYPIDWQEGFGHIYLTDIYIGKIEAPQNLSKSSQGGLYPAGTELAAVVFTFKITISGISPNSYCIPVNMRRLLNEEGDLEPPSNSQFQFSANGVASCALNNTTYQNQKVIFVKSADDKDFEFTTGGASNIFFSVSILKNGKIKIAKEILTDSPAQTPSTNSYIKPTPSPNLPLNISLITPTSPLTINRGDNLSLTWTSSGGNYYSVAYFILSSPNLSYKQYIYPRASDSMASMRVIAPPGNYILYQESKGMNDPSAIKVTVLGPQSTVSLASSSIESEYDEIISDGICKTLLTAYIVDDFNYGLRGKRVVFQSNKSTDSILPDALYSTQDGSITAMFKSNTIGTSTISVIVDGEPLKNPLDIAVLNAKGNDCPSSGGYSY